MLLQFFLISSLLLVSLISKVQAMDQQFMEHAGIHFSPEQMLFTLQSRHSTYAFFVNSLGKLEHLYWGKRVYSFDDLTYLKEQSTPVSFDAGPFNALLLEYSDFGTGDYKIPAFSLRYENDGSSVTPFTYQSHEIMEGLPDFIDTTTPHFRVRSGQRVSSVVIKLSDPKETTTTLLLRYTVFIDEDSIVRSAHLLNHGSQTIHINSLSSAQVDFPPSSPGKPYHLTQLSGSWVNERQINTRVIGSGLTGIESRRGVSSHQQNPFIAISEGQPLEDSGDVFGFGLVYAGNFQVMIQRDQTLDMRVRIGIHPDLFEWALKPGDQFDSPEAVLTYGYGMAQLTRQMHNLVRKSILPGVKETSRWTPDNPRPVLVNSWEAMYFDCSEQRIMNELVRPAKELGIDMVVVDDGWFRNRVDDSHALGDWFVDLEKFPNGLDGLADLMEAEGIELGIWMEPEMISPKSDLYKRHPEWVLHVPGRPRTTSRNQLVLDISREDVQEFIVRSVSRVLKESRASYLKWDFNRHLTEVYSVALPKSQQGELYHRWIVGLYRIWSELTQNFPNVLFESCSGGGGRFDLAFLFYTPQIWTSDNTDGLGRVSIQMGTSLFYPPNAMASHVSAVPNHQVHRQTGMGTRHVVAMSGILGYELSLSKLTDGERQFISTMIQFYKERVQHLVLTGDFYRLSDTLAMTRENHAPLVESWSMVSRDKKEAAVYGVLTSPYEVIYRHATLKLKGLNPHARYKVELYQETWLVWSKIDTWELFGSTLMNAGLVYQMRADVDSFMYMLSELE